MTKQTERDYNILKPVLEELDKLKAILKNYKELESALQWCEDQQVIIKYHYSSFPQPHKWVTVVIGLWFKESKPTLIEAVKQCQLRLSMSPSEYEEKLKGGIHNEIST